MKKVMFVVLALVFAVSAFAQTSNKVGFVKVHVVQPLPGGQATYPFGLPFKFWTVNANVPQYGTESTRPSSIIGMQISPGPAPNGLDRITLQGGQSAYINQATGQWAGTLESSALMVPGKAYWVVNKNASIVGGYDVVLAGEVSNGGYATVTAVPSFVAPATQAAAPISWRDARNVPVPSLGLVNGATQFLQGTTNAPNYTGADRLVPQAGASGFAVLNTSGNWVYVSGFPGYVQPGLAYWIISKHASHPWNYTYSAPAAAAISDNGGVNTPTASFTKAPATTVKATPVDNVKSTTVKKPTTASSKHTVNK